MSAQIRVSPEQLAGVAGQLRSGASSIEGILSQLQGQVAPLGSDWAGVGQARFQALWAQWHTSQRQLEQALGEMSRLMQQASGTYGDSDASVAASFSR
jgi:WXG100 family type VII secretion target